MKYEFFQLVDLFRAIMFIGVIDSFDFGFTDLILKGIIILRSSFHSASF